MTKEKLTDPIGDNKKAIDESEKVATVNDGLPEFTQLSEKAELPPHPFQGYPMGKDKLIQIGIHEGKPHMVLSTFLVGVDPSYRVRPQDKSGENRTIADTKTIIDKDGIPRNKLTGTSRVVTIKNSHSEIVRNHEAGGGNMEVVFDRVIETKRGAVATAVVPSHSARASLIFKLDEKTGKTYTDKKYVLFDGGQEGRLRELFILINRGRIKDIRLAGEIAG